MLLELLEDPVEDYADPSEVHQALDQLMHEEYVRTWCLSELLDQTIFLSLNNDRTAWLS